MKRAFTVVTATLAALAVGGALFAWSGLYDVAASRGHVALMRWLLHFGMRQSVETHALGVSVPDLSDPALVMRGAGHFQGGCAPCHGAPGQPPAYVTRGMLPVPPELSPLVKTWNAAELFWLVKHGLKYTGMPSWPAEGRDDEVWAAVAFLLRLPEMDVAEYRRLAIGDAQPELGDARALAAFGPGSRSIAACARCHGHDGAGREGAYPRIAGQPAPYLERALREYAEGARPSGIMQPVAVELDVDEMRALADYYARKQPPFPQPPRAHAALLERGRQLAELGAPERGVPACAACHGQEGVSRNPLFPLLAGQHAGYLQQQLLLWRIGARGSAPASQIMAAAARRLTEEDARAVSLYYGSIRPD